MSARRGREAAKRARSEERLLGQASAQPSVSDPRRNLMALRLTHEGAKALRRQAVRELGQHGNLFVQRSLATSAGPIQVSAGPGVLARDEAEETEPVKVNATPANSTYTVTGTTLAQAFASIQAYANAHDGEAGSVKWRPGWKMTLDDEGYVKSVAVTANIVKTMPNWPNASKLSTAAKAEWDRVYSELNAHENRHVEILVNGATYIGNSALGSKKADAEKAAAAAQKSINDDNVAIDPFETVMTTDIE